jgi:hypothetical protein
MKLIEKLLLKLGYVKAEKYNELRINYELMQKFDIKLLRMEYQISSTEFANNLMPAVLREIHEETIIRKFFKEVAPFIERRVQRVYPLKVNDSDSMRYELRLNIAVPKTTQQEPSK